MDSKAGPSEPPSYVRIQHEDDRDSIDPIDKTPAFPAPETLSHSQNLNDAPTYGTPTSNLTYFATPTTPPLDTGNGSSSSRSFDPTPYFSRAPPPKLSYPAFKPIFLVATGKTLDKGFPTVAPPSNTQPHPFISHDVGETDWLGFLQAVREAATLTAKDIRRSHLPIISIIPIVNTLAEYGVQKVMKSQKGGNVAKTVDVWNHHFFGPRKLRVVLMKGRVKQSGLTGIPVEDSFAPDNWASVTADDSVYRLIVFSTS